jgi:hypothetical protein
MTRSQEIERAVQVTVRTAHVDPYASREPLDERVQYDVEMLARVIEMIRTPDDLLNAASACQAEFRHQLMNNSNVWCGLAAMQLEERLVSRRQRRYREGEDGIEPFTS